MRRSGSRKKKIAAQTWLLFGLFLLACFVFYSLVNKASNDRKSIGMNADPDAVTVDRSIKEIAAFKANSLSKNKANSSSKQEKLVTKDVESVVAPSVSSNTDAIVTNLRLPDSNRMQAEGFFREGLDRYLQKDYSNAYKNWRKAADLNHAKAYFNLGLLAADEQISVQLGGLDNSKDFFKKAQEYGYAPAAKMLGVDDKAAAVNTSNTAVINHAAKTPQTSDVDESGDEEIAAEEENTAGSNSANITGVGKEGWVASQPDQKWTIQVRAFKEKIELDAFLSDYEFGNNTAYFREPSSQGVLYKLVIGTFDSRDAASKARTSLPTEVLAEGPWLRRFGDIKKTMIGS